MKIICTCCDLSETNSVWFGDKSRNHPAILLMLGDTCFEPWTSIRSDCSDPRLLVDMKRFAVLTELWLEQESGQAAGTPPVTKRIQKVACERHLPTYGCFQKWGYHQIIHFNRVFHYKPSILGYPYFWKHPYPWFRLLIYCSLARIVSWEVWYDILERGTTIWHLNKCISTWLEVATIFFHESFMDPSRLGFNAFTSESLILILRETETTLCGSCLPCCWPPCSDLSGMDCLFNNVWYISRLGICVCTRLCSALRWWFCPLMMTCHVLISFYLFPVVFIHDQQDSSWTMHRKKTCIATPSRIFL